MHFDDTYFRTEIRCGFEVSALMKRAWAAQMEVLRVVIDICERNGIQYFASWGTLLGAVRHQGYIPWDDDVDISVKREEYDRLAQLLPDELPKGFVLRGIHSKTRTGREVTDTIYQIYVAADRSLWDRKEYMEYFHGYPFDYVGVDVFPLDYVSRDREAFEVQRSIFNIAKTIFWNWDELVKNGELEKRLAQFEEVSGMPLPPDERRMHLAKMMNSIASLCRENEGDHLTQFVFDSQTKLRMSEKEWYAETVLLPFENMKIAAPACYDEVLKVMYGDYRQFAQGKAAHDYPYYRKMEEKLLRELREAGIDCGVEEFCEKVMSGEITGDF